MKRVWLEISSTIKYMLKKAFQILPILFTISNPFIAILTTCNCFKKHGAVCGQVVIVPLIILLLTYLSNVINRTIVLQVHGIPIARKRFTRRDERGNVNFSMNDVLEIVEYVNAIEDYCERHGLYSYFDDNKNK